MRSAKLGSLALLAAAAVAAAGVVDLTPSNFDSVVDGSQHVLVEFFAPWCGHCKALAPEYEKVGETFRAGDGVVIAKVDADAHRDLGGRFGVQGFPTLKWFHKGSTDASDYNAGRSADDIVQFINDKTGLRRHVVKPPSDVEVLTASTFDTVVMDPTKNVLVEFYAPWCGHCKALAPKYEKVASAFAGEDNVVVANVDATKEGEIASRFNVGGYPTIKFFPAGSADKTAEDYNGGREVADFVTFLNRKAGTHRTEDGGLTKEAGRVAALDALVGGGADVDADLVAKLEEEAAALSGADADAAARYVKVAKKVLAKGATFVAKEKARLDRMLQSASVTAAKKTNFMLRRNVLEAFQ